jgi:hypothetical protein
MHAVAASVSIQSGHEDEALEFLRTNVVPRVKESPGIVAGYWLAPSGGHGYGLVIYESEDAAQAAVQMAQNSPQPESVTFDTIQVHEVVASV